MKDGTTLPSVKIVPKTTMVLSVARNAPIVVTMAFVMMAQKAMGTAHVRLDIRQPAYVDHAVLGKCMSR